MRRFCTYFLCFFAPILLAGKVSAHATPLEYEPASAAILAKAPETVKIRFSERIDPAASSITVYAPDGAMVDDGKNQVDSADAHNFSTGLNVKEAGTYTVSWQVVSADDGHFTKGGFIFSVGKESGGDAASSGQFQIQHRSDWPEALAIGLELLGSAILLGCIALVFAVWRPIRKTKIPPEDEKFLTKRLRRIVLSAGFLILIGGVGYLFLEGSNLALDQATSFGQAFHSFSATIAGRYAWYRLALGFITSVLLFLNIPFLLNASRFTKREITLFLFLILSALLRARVSHAAASPFFPGFSIFMNTVHLLFKDLWIGGAVVFIFAFLPMLWKEGRAQFMSLALLRFSKLLMISFAVGGVSGVYIIWLHLKSFANLFSTHWGMYFIDLSICAGVLLLLRLYQQLKTYPALIRTAEEKKNAEKKPNSLNFLLLTEMLIGMVVLLFSSMLIITTPPLSPQRFFEETQQTTNATVSFGESHTESDQFLITISRQEVSSDDTEKLTVTLTNEAKGIGPLVAKPMERFPGGFVFPKASLSPLGEWKVNVTEQEPQKFDAVASFTLKYPNDVSAVHAHDEIRTFGVFEVEMLVVALLIFIAAFLFWRQLQDLEKRTIQIPAQILLPSPSASEKGIDLILSFSAISIFFMLSLADHAGSGFSQNCALVGGQWHENVPMRDGQATSDIAALGCMLGSGRGTFHFVDPREFAYFTRRMTAYATLQTNPQEIVPGKPVTLRIHLQDTDGKPVSGLTFEHDRILHAIIVSADLQTFAHIHVEDSGPVTPEMLTTATFPVNYTFPKAGKYLLGVDYTIRAQTFADLIPLTVGNDNEMKAPSPDLGLEKNFAGMDVRLDLPANGLKAGTVQKIFYTFAENGKPVADLEPYLSAAMHLSIVRTDLKKFIHTHAELPQTFLESIFNPRDPNLKHFHVFLPDRFGPKLVAYVLFPLPGEYEMFGEVRRGGKVVVTKLRVNVK